MGPAKCLIAEVYTMFGGTGLLIPQLARTTNYTKIMNDEN